jgi:site-specific DNA-methyltransferase (adenine-specific)
MELNKIYFGDSLELLDNIDDNSVDLVITSPPYADTIFYGDNVDNKTLLEYPEWFAEIGKKIKRILKPSGSFILNINDRVEKKERSLYALKTVIELKEMSGLKFHDTYIWAKQSGLPTGNKKRLNDKFEYIFHFVKDTNLNKCNMDIVREPYAKNTLGRIYRPDGTIKDVGINDKVNADGKIKNKSKKLDLNPLGKIPTNVFSFQTAGVLRGNDYVGSEHPAAFNPELPKWFINWLTDENDVVLDPFIGSGTVAEVCIEMNRKYIGMELNVNYQNLIEKRIKNALLKKTQIKIDM